MGAELTVLQFEAAPSYSSPPATAGGGSFSAGTFHFRPVAFYRSDGDQDDPHWHGINRSLSGTNWDGIVLSGSESITFDWTTATRNGYTVYPHHSGVVMQDQAVTGQSSFDYTQACALVVVTATPYASSATATSPTDQFAAPITYNASADSATLQPVKLRHVERPAAISDTLVGLRPKAMTIKPGTSRILMVLNRSSLFTSGSGNNANAHSHYNTLLKWAGALNYGSSPSLAVNPVYCRITESEDTNAETDAPIQHYFGYFDRQQLSDYANSLGKNEDTDFPVSFMVEYTTTSAQVP